MVKALHFKKGRNVFQTQREKKKEKNREGENANIKSNKQRMKSVEGGFKNKVIWGLFLPISAIYLPVFLTIPLTPCIIY